MNDESPNLNDNFEHALDAYEREDYEEAVKWYRLAAEQRHEQAQFNLEMMHGNSPN